MKTTYKTKMTNSRRTSRGPVQLQVLQAIRHVRQWLCCSAATVTANLFSYSAFLTSPVQGGRLQRTSVATGASFRPRAYWTPLRLLASAVRLIRKRCQFDWHHLSKYEPRIETKFSFNDDRFLYDAIFASFFMKTVVIGIIKKVVLFQRCKRVLIWKCCCRLLFSGSFRSILRNATVTWVVMDRRREVKGQINSHNYCWFCNIILNRIPIWVYQYQGSIQRQEVVGGKTRHFSLAVALSQNLHPSACGL